MREVFVDAVKANNIPIMRCMLEADDEIAILARKLQAPVLSYDSDFYIHNVQYIPYVTITHKIYRKTIADEKNYEIKVIKNKANGKKGKNTKKNIKKDKKVTVGELDKVETEKFEEYNYLDCSIYTVENLIGRKSLQNEMLPLFATLLGNDFIERRVLRKFYSSVRVKKGKKKGSPQQRRIATIFEWLKNESLNSALHKIVGVMKERERETLLRQIKAAMDGYSSEKSEAYEYFGFTEEVVEDIDLNELLDCTPEPSENEDSTNETGNEESENEENDDEEDDHANSAEEVEDDLIQQLSPLEETIHFPDWLRNRYNKADFPRFFVDLYKSRRYVNYPQVEDLSLEDSNEISYPILVRIYAILHSPNPPPTLWYMTRVQRYARFYYKKFENVPAIENFNPNKSKNIEEFRKLFTNVNHVDEIFTAITKLPDQLQLYTLAIIYWMINSKLTTSIHLHTVVLGIIVTFIIDKKFEITHDEVQYQKKYSKLLPELKEKFTTGTEDKNIEFSSFSSAIKSITRHEAILSMEKIVPCFNLKGKFKRKHIDFNQTAIHSFAELQSVCFFFYSYNALCNYPFPNIKMSNFFNGFFIYHMHTSLRGRTDVNSYLTTHLFKYSLTISLVHQKLFEFCKTFLPSLEKFDQLRLTKPKVNIKLNKIKKPVGAQNLLKIKSYRRVNLLKMIVIMKKIQMKNFMM